MWHPPKPSSMLPIPTIAISPRWFTSVRITSCRVLAFILAACSPTSPQPAGPHSQSQRATEPSFRASEATGAASPTGLATVEHSTAPPALQDRRTPKAPPTAGDPEGASLPLQEPPSAAAALLESMASTASKVYIRGGAECEEWVLTGTWGNTLERIHLQRVVGTRRVRGTRRRQRVRRSFMYTQGHIVDADAGGRYEDVWDAESREWKPFSEDLSQNACSDVFEAFILGDGSIALGHHRWYLTPASCKAATSATVVVRGGCTGATSPP